MEELVGLVRARDRRAAVVALLAHTATELRAELGRTVRAAAGVVVAGPVRSQPVPAAQAVLELPGYRHPIARPQDQAAAGVVVLAAPVAWRAPAGTLEAMAVVVAAAVPLAAAILATAAMAPTASSSSLIQAKHRRKSNDRGTRRRARMP